MSLPSKSIVVLPFVNMSSDTETEYFSDGITEEIINALTTIPELKVIARTSAFSFKDKNIDIRDIAQQLNVATVLEGSIRRSANRIRVTAQFINAEDGSHFWAKNYDRELNDVFAIQDEISLLIAEKIRENFGHFEIPEHLQPERSHPIQAYDWYLKGLHHLKRKDFKDIKLAISYFENALKQDPNYPEAFACIAESYIHYLAFGELDPAEGFKRITENAEKALAINPNNARAHKVIAYLKLFSWDWNGAEDSYNKAIANGMAPENEFISYYHIFIKGEKEYAIDLAKNLLLTDPLHAFSHWQLGACYYFNQQFKEALQAFNNALQIEPNFVEALRWKGLVLGYLKQFEKAVPLIEKAIDLSNGQLLPRIDLMVVKILMGQTQAVLQEMNTTEFLDVCDPAMLYSLMNIPEKAIPLLQKGVEQQTMMLISLKHFFVWDNLRDHDAFKQLLAQINFPSEVESISINKPKALKALLSKTEIETYSKTLNILIEKQSIYLDAQLNLKNLAAQLGISANKLSWLLNSYYKKNFNEFINAFRLAHFKHLALQPENKNLTLIAIAYDCGFNSKTVFNTYFKKMEGVTPKVWVKMN